MSDFKRQITEGILPRVQMPAQYVGGEINSVVKSPDQVRGTLCLAFPDLYTVGMSHYGLQVLYAAVNAMPDIWCQRAFLPEQDMAALLRERGLPLYGLEGFTPLSAFDVVGFSLQYEISYTNVLEMLDLGGIPLRTADRTLADPLVIAGGPCPGNPEPMHTFIDVFVLGDGEQSLPMLLKAYLDLKADGGPTRREILIELASRFPWAYVPSLYEARYHDDGRLAAMEPTSDRVPDQILPCVLSDLDACPIPTRPVVPFVQTIHDRIAIEIMRGCPWQCRFCQSTGLKRPLRFRKIETIVQAAVEAYRNTGYDQVSLLSLSTGDYPEFPALIQALRAALTPRGVSLSVPSLRVNEQLQSLPELVAEVRKSGLTLAPEAAREEMRTAIGKRISDEDLYEGVRTAYRMGWRQVKLYFMIGLPGERDEDLDAIIEMAHEVSGLRRQIKGRPANVNVSISSFVPKPHTPLQWAPMATRAYLQDAHRRLRERVKMRSVRLRMHDVGRSMLEGFLCRGDRRVADVIEAAWRAGAILDAWDEHFNPAIWDDAIATVGLDPDWYRHRPRDPDELLPWDHIHMRRSRDYLKKQFAAATQP